MNNGSAKRHPADEHFVETFTERILGKAAGLAPEHAVIHGTAPRRLFFGAVLCATRENQSREEKQQSERYRPTSCGLDFICRPGASATVTLRISFNVYGVFYQPFETLETRPAPGAAYLPALSYRRFPVSFESEIALSELEAGMHELRRISREIDKLLDTVTSEVVSRNDALRDRDAGGPKHVPLHAWTADSYAAAIFQGDKVLQIWKCAVSAHMSETEAGRRIQIFLQNASIEADGTLALDQNLYGASLSIAIEPKMLEDIPLERAPLRDYRYRRSVIVQGINCNSTYDKGSGVLSTCFMPTFQQMRYLPLESYNLSFKRIRTEPESVFEEISTGLVSYTKAWSARLRIGDLGIKSDEDLRIAQGFFDEFIAESDRIRDGIALIQSNSVVREAFLLMTATFERIGDMRRSRAQHGMTAWYLFQFCFILSLIKPFVSRNGDSAGEAHLLWFPTGGGKTEAVMGIVVFAMFYERLTGREYGITSWMRFPLRLLTFQQMQRYVDVIIAADLERIAVSKTSPSLAAGPFSIGYFGGRRNSPNSLRRVPDDIQLSAPLRKRLRDALQRNLTGIDVLLDREGCELFQDLRIVTDCFYCGSDSSVAIVGDPVALTMRHKCSACGRYLPIYTIDDDIYTQLPTVVVGTLDKLATMGFRAAFRTMVGKSDGRCEKHGYGTFGKCLKSFFGQCNHSNWKPRRTPESSYGGISILFQDELHLIHEQLGCFDAHYESLLISLCTEAGGRAPLIIAASATIEGADHQLEHLYEAKGVRFPGEGPSLRDTFYASETPDLQRLYVGIKPSNLAHLDTTMSLTTFVFEELSWLRHERFRMERYYPALASLSEDEYQELLDRHTLDITYVNSKREGQNIYRSVDEQVRDNLKRARCDEIFGVTPLTGDSTMDEVKDALRRMKGHRADLPDSEKLDFAVATSMISHGVDVDRLNAMVFFSYPRTTAEYIQASSRAGRMFPGIVFVVLKSTTYRDRSFYRNFREVHEALDKMVETVPIDRFAVHAVQRTAPGLAVGTLINRSVDHLRKAGRLSIEDAREIDNLQTLKRLVIGGMHFKDVVKNDLDVFYRVTDSRAADWRAEIVKLLDRLDTNIASAGERASIPAELNYTETRVMTSLRDVDPPLEVNIRNRISTERGIEDE